MWFQEISSKKSTKSVVFFLSLRFFFLRANALFPFSSGIFVHRHFSFFNDVSWLDSGMLKGQCSIIKKKTGSLNIQTINEILSDGFFFFFSYSRIFLYLLFLLRFLCAWFLTIPPRRVGNSKCFFCCPSSSKNDFFFTLKVSCCAPRYSEQLLFSVLCAVKGDDGKPLFFPLPVLFDLHIR